MSDRWFIACVRSLTRITSWARREAGLVDPSPPNHGAPYGLQAASSVLDHVHSDALQARSTALDLLLAEPASGAPDASADVPEHGLPDGRSSGARPIEPAGVLLLWRTLGRVVSQHAHTGYRSLQTDARFWALVDLIQSLAHEPSELARAEDHDSASQRDSG